MSNAQSFEGLDLSGRIAVITGAAGGMGSVIAKDLTSLGARVVVCDLREGPARQVASGLEGAMAAWIDLADPTSVDRAVSDLLDKVGHVDILVNNAGWDHVAPFLDTPPEIWDKLIAINLRGPIHLTHTLLPGMAAGGWGRVVFISSDAARVGSSGEAIYSACKGGVISFAKTIAREFARKGITSNVVCPGPSDTPLLGEIARDHPNLVEALKKAIPMGRLGQPDDISGVVSFLCSDRASYITGQTLSVSGGLTMA